MLSAAKHRSDWAHRCFAALSMTGLDLSVAEELSSSFEPCLKTVCMCWEWAWQPSAVRPIPNTYKKVLRHMLKVSYVLEEHYNIYINITSRLCSTVYAICQY